jgi:23S rRNA pseudouridine2605 synthase
MAERVQKILANWGVASRRQAEKLILAGRVSLNGSVVNLGQLADPHNDRLEVDGLVIKNRPQLTYILLNKPAGVISTCDDPQGRSTVLELLPPSLRKGQGIHPVGRLDRDSTGALLLTNDGELTLSLTHPRYHLPKTYRVWVEGRPSEAVLETWRNGVELLGKKTLPAEVTILQRERDKTLLEIVLTEGRNRQIRSVAQQLGYNVVRLHRSAIGLIRLRLPVGKYRLLKDYEIDFLRKGVNLARKEIPVNS